MVNVVKGVLVECDPAMKQFLLHLDEKHSLGGPFVIQVLDDTHLFIAADMVERLQDQIDDLMDKMNVPVVDGKNAEAKNWKKDSFYFVECVCDSAKVCLLLLRAWRSCKMIRRDPTRIEFTMEDVEVYKARRDKTASKTTVVAVSANTTTQVDGKDVDAKSKADAIRERIGYDPTPRSSWDITNFQSCRFCISSVHPNS